MTSARSPIPPCTASERHPRRQRPGHHRSGTSTPRIGRRCRASSQESAAAFRKRAAVARCPRARACGPVTPACSGGFGNQTVPGVAFCGTAMHSSILSTRSLGCSHVCRSPTGAVRYPVLPAPPSRTHVVVSHRPDPLRDLAGARCRAGRRVTAGLCRTSLSPLSRMRHLRAWPHAVRKILDQIGYVKWFYDRFSTGTGRSMCWVFCPMYGGSWPKVRIALCCHKAD